MLASTAFADGPATGVSTTADVPEEKGKVHFKGFDLGLTSFESTGLFFKSESYYNVLSIWLEPSYALGKQLFGEDSFWAPLTAGARLPIDVEFTSNDARFRGPHYGSSSIFQSPDSVPLSSSENPSAAPIGVVDGTERRPIQLDDTWLTLVHPKLYMIPKAKIQIGSGLRIVLPTSPLSRNAGLVAAPSLGVFFDRKFGPVTVGYAIRGGKSFYTRTSPKLQGSDTAVINGQTVQLWQPDSTGIPNTNYGGIQGLSVDWKLPKSLDLSLNYFLISSKPYALSGCAVPDVPTANVCTDGALVGKVDPGAWRHDQWFLAMVEWTHEPIGLALGLSTYRNLRAPDGHIGEPFVYVTAENATTVFLSFDTSAERIASAFKEHK